MILIRFLSIITLMATKNIDGNQKKVLTIPDFDVPERCKLFKYQSWFSTVEIPDKNTNWDHTSLIHDDFVGYFVPNLHNFLQNKIQYYMNELLLISHIFDGLLRKTNTSVIFKDPVWNLCVAAIHIILILTYLPFYTFF